MENNESIKCSSQKHKELNAILYCQECNLNMCNKCKNFHSELFENHHIYNLDKNTKEIFTGFCKDKNHNKELKYFCKNHNRLCCAVCLSKIKDNENGQHNNCEVCLINEIEKDKKNKLIENIKCLENISNDLQINLDIIKNFGEKLTETKEKLKIDVQNIFTKLRNEINKREDELLNEIDKHFEKTFFDENMIKKSEKLPIKIKSSIEKGKIIEKEWEKNELNSLINDCINIEDDIKEINLINEKIKKIKENESIKINIETKDEDIQNIINKIKSIGNINEEGKFTFIFQEGKNHNLKNGGLIATKTGPSGWNCVIYGNKEIPKNKISTWKIKLNNFCIKSNTWNVLIGIGPKILNNEECFYNYCWSFICGSSKLSVKSGGETNYNNHSGKLKEGDIVTVIVDREKGNLSFAVNDINYGLTNIKINEKEELYPVVLIYDQWQIVEIV